MKKIISLVLVLALVLSCSALVLVGCDDTDGGVHVFWYTGSDTYLSSVRTALEEDLTEAGITATHYDANNDSATQVNQFDTAMAMGASVIVMNIVDPTAGDTVAYFISECEEAGIPIIFFNREIDDEYVNSYDQCAFVGTSTTEAGVMQGEMIAELLLEDYDSYDLNGDGYISYIMLKGQEGNAEADGRTEYSVSVSNAALIEAGELGLQYYDGTTAGSDKYYVDKDGAWSADEGYNFTSTVLGQYTEASGNMVELVIANNDSMAIGAINALKAADYNTGETGCTTIPVFGVDATDEAVAAIAAGTMAGTVKQSATGMAEAVTLLVENAVAGEADLMTGITLTVDESCDKIRVAYEKYSG